MASIELEKKQLKSNYYYKPDRKSSKDRIVICTTISTELNSLRKIKLFSSFHICHRLKDKQGNKSMRIEKCPVSFLTSFNLLIDIDMINKTVHFRKTVIRCARVIKTLRIKPNRPLKKCNEWKFSQNNLHVKKNISSKVIT